MKLYTLALILVLGLCANKIMAATGCIRNSTGVLYTTKTGSNYTGGAVNNPHSLYCIKSTGTCTVRLSNTNYAGTLVSYNPPIGCPIDKDINALLGLTGVGGYVFLRRHINRGFMQTIS